MVVSQAPRSLPSNLVEPPSDSFSDCFIAATTRLLSISTILKEKHRLASCEWESCVYHTLPAKPLGKSSGGKTTPARRGQHRGRVLHAQNTGPDSSAGHKALSIAGST